MNRPHGWLVAALVAIAALGAASYHVARASDARDRAVTERDASRAEARGLRLAARSATTRLGAATRERSRIISVRDRATLSVGQNEARLVLTRRGRNEALDVRDATNGELLLVADCLAGAGRALDALRRFDPAGTIAALTGVDGPCRAAHAADGSVAPFSGFDFPDPSVLVVGDRLYAFATNSTGGTIQTLARQGDGSWTTAGTAIAALPPWAQGGATWGPTVIAHRGAYVMFYAAAEKGTGRQCLSKATATSPTGPYVDVSTVPFECGDTGAIDPDVVIDGDGTPVLIWKHERPATIYARTLDPVTLDPAGPPKPLLRASQRWEGGVVEAPSMLVSSAGTWLIYSANDWNGRHYSIGVVRCLGPLGPCARSAPAPLLAATEPVMGPGGAAVFSERPGEYQIIYHAYQTPNVGYPASRLPFFARLDLSTGSPVIVR